MSKLRLVNWSRRTIPWDCQGCGENGRTELTRSSAAAARPKFTRKAKSVGNCYNLFRSGRLISPVNPYQTLQRDGRGGGDRHHQNQAPIWLKISQVAGESDRRQFRTDRIIRVHTHSRAGGRQTYVCARARVRTSVRGRSLSNPSTISGR